MGINNGEIMVINNNGTSYGDSYGEMVINNGHI
jgi:hypothetical protein